MDFVMKCLACGGPKPAQVSVYPTEVINAASRALEALTGLITLLRPDSERALAAVLISDSAIRIIRDGLASHELAIKGE